MKNRLLQVYLEQQTAPKVIEAKNSDWIIYGDGDYKNAYPQFLIDLYNSSATHSAIVNATANMIAGDDIIIDEEDADLGTFVELKKFMANINRHGETAHELLKKSAFDLKLQGGFFWNIIWSKDKSKIVEIHHIPAEQVRAGKRDESGHINDFYLSADWSKYRQKEYEPRRVAAFNTIDRSEGSQLYYCGLYSPGMEIYHTPDYLASTNWILVDNLTSEFHLSNITNGFAPSYWINFNNGVPTDEERHRIEQQIRSKFTGAGNAGKFVLTFSDDKDSAPDLQAIQLSDADKQYTVLNELCIQNIMIGHRVTSPMLLGVKTDGQLGGRNELLEAYELYSNTVIQPFQDNVLKALKMVLNINNINLPISIQDIKPLNSMFDADVLSDVLTEDEIREELGYAPREQATELKKFSEESALDFFIRTYGEDEDLDNWELIDEQELQNDDEHPDFDFEYNLNLLAEKRNFVRTGRGDRVERRSKQDGVSKDFNLFRVRYVYDTKGGHTSQREFCRKMEQANKVYRKEDIVGQAHSLSSIKANPQFSGNESGIYDIWLWKGGANCHHSWTRRVYMTKFGDTPNILTDDVLSTAKARSKGFYPEPNEREVSVAPIDMPNKGYKTKR